MSVALSSVEPESTFSVNYTSTTSGIFPSFIICAWRLVTYLPESKLWPVRTIEKCETPITLLRCHVVVLPVTNNHVHSRQSGIATSGRAGNTFFPCLRVHQFSLSNRYQRIRPVLPHCRISRFAHSSYTTQMSSEVSSKSAICHIAMVHQLTPPGYPCKNTLIPFACPAVFWILVWKETRSKMSLCHVDCRNV